MKITDFSVDRPVSITMLVSIVMVLGILSLTRLGIDMLPEIDYPTLTVMVRYPGAPSEEIETMVAHPYEGVLAGVDGITKVSSISQEDVCYLMLEFDWGTDLDAAAADIREAVAFIEPYMPEDVEDPMVVKFNLSKIPQAAYAVSGIEDTVALRRLMEDVVQSRLERLDGVATAGFLGGRTEEIQVRIDRAALYGSSVSLDQVGMALAAQNLNLPAGRQIQDHREYLLRTVGVFTDLHDIEDVAVGMSKATGTPIRLGSLGEVVRTTKEVRNFVRANGYEALMLMVMKESGANPLKVRRAFLHELEEVKPLLPESVHFDNLFDTARVIDRLARGVVQNGLLGALLAVGVMFFFLRSIRPTLTIATVIPLSLLATFIPIYAYGDTLNMMTMGGLVLGIGMLVDNAVVVIENIFRHIEEGASRTEAARRGAGEVGMAITASTFTTMVVFLPILFSQGLAGQLARGLAITVAAALFASLFVAITIVPMLASVFFSSRAEGAVIHESPRFTRFKKRYERLLAWCVGHRALTLAGLGLITALSLCVTPIVGAEFMPESDQPILTAKVSFPVGTPLATTAAATRQVEAAIASFDDVLRVGSQLGVDENDASGGLSETNPAGPHEAIVFARLKDAKDRSVRHNSRLQAMILEKIPDIEGMKLSFIPMGGMGGSTHDVDIKLYGADLPTLGQWSERVAAQLEGVEGLTAIDTSVREAKPEKHIHIDRDKAASYGLTVGQVARSLKTATLGAVVTRFREAGEEIDVRVQYAEPWRATEQDLEQVLIPTPAGGTVPLGQLATVELGKGPVKIVREDQARMVSVYADLDGTTDLRTVMSSVKRAVAPIQEALPRGYFLEYGGQYEDMIDAFGQLLLALILAVLMVYMVMASQFESFSHPFTIMFTMPLAFIGVIWIFLFTGTTLSVPTFLGVIMLAGIVVNNGIVLVDYVNQLRARGIPIREAVVQGAATRLRPVLITSLTTIMAMVPMAFSHAQGSETMAPLGLTIIGGLSAATVLTLVVVPVVYTLVDGASSRLAALAMRLLHGEEAQA